MKNISKMTVVALRAMAKSQGLKGYSRLRKADLVALLTIKKEDKKMTIQEKCEEIAARAKQIAGVNSASIWTSVAGKERVYIDLMRADKQGHDYGGVGGRVYVDVNSGKIVAGKDGYNGTPFFNSYTKSYHEANGTIAKIAAAI